MSRRRINPDTGEVELTYREEKLVDEYIKNGGNGKAAAEAAGYGTARADQSAYQVLRRAEVQRRIRDHSLESRVSSEEIIGTLVSCMRGNLGRCFNEEGDFDINMVKNKRLDHLLNTVSETTREIRGRNGQPPEVITNYRVQLHSPLQAASILGRLLGLNRDSWQPNSLNPGTEDQLDTADLAPPEVSIGDPVNLAGFDSSRSSDSGFNPHTIEAPVGSSLSSPDSGLRSQVHTASPRSSGCNVQLQHWQPFRRLRSGIGKLRKVNVTQCLKAGARALGAAQPDARLPTDTRGASP